MQSEDAKEILTEIDQLSKQINGYHLIMNQESNWLFLAVIGSYGINNPAMRMTAMMAIVVYFGYSIYDIFKFRHPDSHFNPWRYSLIDLIKYIEIKISKKLDVDSEEYAYCMKELNKCRQPLKIQSIFFSLKNLRLLIAWIFFGLSFFLTIRDILHSMLR